MTIDTIKHYLQFVTKSVNSFGVVTFTSLDGNFQSELLHKVARFVKSFNYRMEVIK